METVLPRNADRDELGGLIYELKAFRRAYLICPLLFFAAVACAVMPFTDEKINALGRVGMPLFGIAVFAGGVYMMRWSMRQRLCVYENGLSSGSYSLTFAEIDGYSRTNTELYVDGFYTETIVSLTFSPRTGIGAAPIQYSQSVDRRKGDERIDALHQLLVDLIQGRLIAEFAETGMVRWVDGLAFKQHGIEYATPQGLRSISYGVLEEPSIESGIVRLRQVGLSEPLCEVPEAAPNSYAVLGLLHYLRSGRADWRPTSEQPSVVAQN